MVAVAVEALAQMEDFGRAGLDAEAASFALIWVGFDYAAIHRLSS